MREYSIRGRHIDRFGKKNKKLVFNYKNTTLAGQKRVSFIKEKFRRT